MGQASPAGDQRVRPRIPRPTNGNSALPKQTFDKPGVPASLCIPSHSTPKGSESGRVETPAKGEAGCTPDPTIPIVETGERKQAFNQDKLGGFGHGW